MRGRSDRETPRNGAVTSPLVSSFATAGTAPAAYDDPMSKVLGLDEKTSGLAAWFGFTSGSTLLLVALMALTSVVAWMHRMQARTDAAPEEIEVVKDDPPPPPPAEPEPKAEPTAAEPHRVRGALPPPPAPAQAAKVLTREPDPNEPVDLTANTIVQGNSDAYAGGFTASNGSSANAVHAVPAATGVPGGTGPLRARDPGAPDLTRVASLGTDADWDCPFPREAETMQIDDAYVLLQVDVRADGTPASVRVASDPGNGFAREARTCAMARKYKTALDRDGKAIAGTTRPFKVHFQLR